MYEKLPPAAPQQQADAKPFDEIALRGIQVKDLMQLLAKKSKAVPAFAPYEKKEEKVATGEDNADNMSKTLNGATTNNVPPQPPYANIYFYHPDHLGSSTYLTDANSMPYQFFLNLPFGETMAEQHSLTEDYATPYKFSGKEFDRETGLYYYGARYYDPKTSIWLSVDPMADKYPSINPYIYCNQSPVTLSDPTGLYPINPYPDLPTFKWYKENIFPELSRKSTIYVIQEISHRVKQGNGNYIAVVPDVQFRKYRKVLINEGTDANAPIVYIRQEVSRGSDNMGGPNFEHSKLEGSTEITEINFTANSDEITTPNALKNFAENAITTDDIIEIQGNTDLNRDGIATMTINGVTGNATVSELVDARAQAVSNELVNLGISPERIKIVAPGFRQAGHATKLVSKKEPVYSDIKPHQIINEITNTDSD